MPTCLACAHPARDKIDELIIHGRVVINGENIITVKRLSEVLARDYPNERNPNEFALGNHKRKNHASSSSVVAFVHANGEIQLADGTMVPRVSVVDYLDTVVALANFNNLKNPGRVTAAQGNDAVALKYKIQRGAIEKNEIMDSWAEMFRAEQEKAKKKGKKTAEDEEPLDAEYQVVE